MIPKHQRKLEVITLVYSYRRGEAIQHSTESCKISKNNRCFPKILTSLQTDASGYGIGAIAQLVDNIEQPVAFVSKSLSHSIQVG
jgi:hypothetical protein